ncbi:MAG: hypothetical protein L7V86_11150 [Verrucomicrobiales bacterium]|nr:hypothetical protein [Verrucomicrobiales bacterium]
MSRNSFISPVSSEAADGLSAHGGPTMASLPGLGFSIWTSATESNAAPQKESGSLDVGRGFSLPDSKQPRRARAHILRGFSKNQMTRIVKPTVTRPDSEISVVIPAQPELRVIDSTPGKTKTTAVGPLPIQVPKKPEVPIEPAAADSAPEQHSQSSTAKHTTESVPAQPQERTIDPPQPMTSPSSVHLPGNGFSVWTEQSPACQSIHLVSDSPSDADHGGSSIGSSGSGGSDNGPNNNFKTHPEPSGRSGGGGFLKWAALFLFLCALGAFLSSESGRKKVIAERDVLQVEKEDLTKEKQTLHDNWVGEQAVTAKLTDEVSGLETSLAQAKTNITTLTAEKTGLSKTIEQLQGTLAMTIDEAKNTEMTLRKAIKGLETKNEQLTSNLQQEREKLDSLDTRLSEVMSELSAAKASNKELVEEKANLEDKVAQLQYMLDKTVKDAETSEAELRSELADLKKANEELNATLASQKEALAESEEKLKASEKALAEDEDNTQSRINDLSEKLDNTVAARDALNEEKQALAASVAQMTEQLEAKAITSPTTIALKERITELEADKSKSSKQVQDLAATRDNLLERNAELQASVETLNASLSKLAESEETQEGTLTKRINELTKTNENLQQSLKKQRHEFDTLLRSASQAKPVSEPSASTFKGAVNDLKDALGQSLQRETTSKEQLSDLLVDHTNQILELNTQVAKTKNELDSTKGLLTELDSLRSEVHSLRAQGEHLENELAQRAIHISTLNNDTASWQQETEKLRKLLQTEQLAQYKLREFANDLQLRITDLETPGQAVATK